MQKQKILIPLLLIPFLAAIVTGCGERKNSGNARAKPTRYFIFVDRSISPGAEQLAFWTKAAEKRVFQRIQPGDTLSVYEVTERTGETAPIYEATVPQLDDGSGIEATMRVRRAVADMRTAGLSAIESALRVATAKQTRLLDSIRRITRDSSRQTYVLYLTDALESSPELDLERTKLTDHNLVSLIQTALTQHRCDEGLLNGVTVEFVLDSPATDKHRLNNHQALEKFWSGLFTKLGANLASFDSRIPD